jgi:hypothetical protein
MGQTPNVDCWDPVDWRFTADSFAPGRARTINPSAGGRPSRSRPVASPERCAAKRTEPIVENFYFWSDRRGKHLQFSGQVPRNLA